MKYVWPIHRTRGFRVLNLVVGEVHEAVDHIRAAHLVGEAAQVLVGAQPLPVGRGPQGPLLKHARVPHHLHRRQGLVRVYLHRAPLLGRRRAGQRAHQRAHLRGIFPELANRRRDRAEYSPRWPIADDCAYQLLAGGLVPELVHEAHAAAGHLLGELAGVPQQLTQRLVDVPQPR
eukprot:2185096-Pyramimonas_sp.AAC.1